MSVDFSKNHFELFDLPTVFPVDEAELVARFQTLQRELHPDRFAAASDTEKRWSVQAASLVNEAYQKLSQPLSRAAYLLTLHGIGVDEETDTHMDPMFLMQQMELREAIDDASSAADPFSALEAVSAELREGVNSCTQRFTAAADKSDWPDARLVVREWQFFDKLKREVKSLEARLDDAIN